MSRGPKFTKARFSRALQAAREAGYSVNKAVISRAGDIEFTFGTADSVVDPSTNEWDAPASGEKE